MMLCNHLSGGWHPIAAHFIAEHYVMGDNMETASYYGWMNALTFNVGLHNEHHDFPLVPWSRLFELERIGKYRETLPYHESWIRVWWTFITDPAVTLYNRVKRKAKTVDGRYRESPIPSDYDGRFWKTG